MSLQSTDALCLAELDGAQYGWGKRVNCEICSQQLQRFFQLVAWTLALLIVVLSIGPPSIRPVTLVGHDFEHLFIFLATGAAFGIGYAGRFRSVLIGLLAFTAAIELAQLLVPGRHARLSDFLTDGAASCLGIGLSYLLLKAAAARIKI